MNQEENTYINQKDDKEAKNLVNSYRYKSPSSNHYKFWTPDISQEEISRRKRQREDRYIHQFDETDRPILVIQNKEDYQNQHLPVFQSQEDQNNYVKFSNNTHEIENVKEQIMGQSNFIRRQTKVHGAQKPEDHSTHLYKIEGIEFLPQGFLELDPLLYHDEFAFENSLHKDLFSEQQRKMKAIRRKQYEMRNKYKMRNVTLYIADEKTEKVIQFLEKWYFKKRRKMNPNELDIAAQELGIDTDAMEKLQENYLNYKKIQNTKDLHDYLVSKGKVKGGNLTVPNSLKKYFVKNQLESTKDNGKKKNYWDLDKKQQTSKSRLQMKDVNFNPENSQKFQEIKKQLGNDENLQGYFDNEIDKILYNIKSQQPNQYMKNNNLSETKNSKKSNQNYNNVVDQQAIDEIIQQILNAKQDNSEVKQNPKKLYQEMMKQKISKSKFTKPKANGSRTPQIKNTPNYQKNKQKSKLKKDQIDKVNLMYKNFDGDTKMIQKLEPIWVGNQYCFMSIEEIIPKIGTPSVNLVTRDDQGVIISMKPIEMENLGKFYQTKVYVTPDEIKRDNNYTIVVENDKGNTISTNNINEKNPVYMNEGNTEQRLTVSNPSGNQKYENENGVTHVLQPVTFANSFYQQVVREILDDQNEVKLEVITHDRKGTVLAKDSIKGDYGHNFNTIIDDDIINKEGNRELTLLTKDDKGNELARHYLSMNNKQRNSEFINQYLQGTINQVLVDGVILRTYSIPAVIHDKTFFKQVLYEESDDKGGRKRYLITLNEKGEIVSQDSIQESSLGKCYKTEVMSEKMRNNQPYVLLATKNDRNEIINLKEVCVYFDENGLSKMKEFKTKTKGKKSFVETNDKKKSFLGKTHTLQPVIFNGNFYQQFIEEETQGANQKIQILTKDEDGNVLSNCGIDSEQFQGKEFQTKISKIENSPMISVLTLNEKKKVICEDQFDEQNVEILNQEYVDEFDRKAKNKTTLVKKNKFGAYKSNIYQIRPASIGDQAFQQKIVEFIDQNNDKERFLITKDKYDRIVALDTLDKDVKLDDELMQKFVEVNEEQNSVVICLINDDNVEIAKQLVKFNSDIYQKNEGIKNDKTIRHTLALKQNGLDHYNQIVEEILDGDQLKLVVKNQNENGEIEEHEVNSNLVGNNYKTEVVGSFLQQDGKRKTTIAVTNERDEILKEFQIEEEEQPVEEDEIFFDGVPFIEMKKNTVLKKKSQKGVTTLKRLRQTQVGKKTYDCSFEEVVGNDGKKRLTFRMKDENEDLIVEKPVDSNFISENYECYLDQKMGEIDNLQGLVFRNSRSKLLKLKDIYKENDNEIPVQKSEYDDVKEIIDSQGRRTGTIFCKKNKNEEIKTHKLRPTLIGSQYYQITVNELMTGDQKRSTIIVSDEKGEVVLMEEIDPTKNGEEYYTKIIDEMIDNKNERRVTIQLLNEKDEVIQNLSLSPEVQTYYQDLQTDVIEQLTDNKGNKRTSVIPKNFKKKVLDVIEEENTIKERDTNLSSKQKIDQFENLLKKYGGKARQSRLSINQRNPSVSQRSKANTMNILQKPKFGTSQLNNTANSEDEELREIFDTLESRKSQLPQVLNEFDQMRKSSVGQLNESDLQKHASILMNQQKDKVIEEMLSDLIKKNDSMPEDEIGEFIKYCEDELIHDSQFKDYLKKFYTLTKPLKSNPEMITNFQNYQTIKNSYQNLLDKNTSFQSILPEQGKKLPARQRIETILDTTSFFLELSQLAGHDLYEKEVTLCGGIITGIGLIENIPTMIICNDYKQRGGSYYPITVKKQIRAQEIAENLGLPCLYIVDSAGANLPRQDNVFPDRDHFGRIFYNISRMSAKKIPQISVVMGSCTAGGAYVPAMSDKSVIVQNQGTVFLGGPPLVKAATGEIVSAEELGGGDTHTKISGVCDYLARDELEACGMIKKIFKNFDSKFKQNFTQQNNVINSLRREQLKELEYIYDPHLKQSLEVKELIYRLIDDNNFDEFKENFGKTLITGIGNLYQQKVGFIANNGILFSESALKASQFIQLCDQQNIPLIFLQNITGFMIGKSHEWQGIAKHGAKMVNAVANTSVPKLTLVFGASYGAGNYGMCGRAYSPDFMFSWPNSRLGVMGGEQAAKVMTSIKKNLNEQEKEKYFEELKQKYDNESQAIYGTSRLWDDGIVMPEDTRDILGLSLMLTKNKNKFQDKNSFGVFRM